MVEEAKEIIGIEAKAAQQNASGLSKEDCKWQPLTAWTGSVLNSPKAAAKTQHEEETRCVNAARQC